MINSIKDVAVAEAFEDFKTGRKVKGIFHITNLNVERYFAVPPVSLIYEYCLLVIFVIFSKSFDDYRENHDRSHTHVKDRRSQEIISVSVVTCTI